MLYFNAICKDSNAIKCITVQHKKSLIPVNFDASVFSEYKIYFFLSFLRFLKSYT
jgi:hypothetical protein